MVQGFILVAFFYQISGAIPYLRAISIVKSVCMLVSRSSPLALGGEICVAAGGACLGCPSGYSVLCKVCRLLIGWPVISLKVKHAEIVI